MQDFLKGGSITISRAKILETTPILIKTMPIFARSNKLLALPVNWPFFPLKILQNLAKVSHRHRFLSSSTRKGGSISYDLAYQQYLVIDPAQKGGSMEPQEPP